LTDSQIRPRIWPILAIVATIALFGGYVWYTRALVADIRQDTERLATLYARALSIGTPDEAQLLLFEEIIQNFPYPVILTDPEGNPTAFKNLGDLGIESETGPWSPAERLKLRQEAARMDRIADPYPVIAEEGEIVQEIHVSEAGTITLLRYLPYIQGVGLAAVALIAFWLIRYNLRVQRGQIWVAMARESAHQLGTPISSLYGWVELLRAERASIARTSVGASVDAKGASEGAGSEIDVGVALAAMEQDIERLSKVATRFELIGRRPRLETIDLHDLMGELEEYCRARLPRRGKPIRLVTDFAPVPLVNANRTLVEWALENLIKNAVDALEGKGGRIELRAAPGPTGGTVEIEVADDGPGIPRVLRKQIFETGVSTKPQGWGVGLSLAQRIVEEYHDGSLELVSADPGTGTTFRITLPAAGADAEGR
jgi:signal transduction histidine kinase